MKISSISLTNFRSYKERQFELAESTTIITGQNGVGKTNLLEAIFVLCTGESFRDSDDLLTKFDENWWKISGVVSEKKREIRYTNRPTKSKQLVVDQVVHKRITTKQKLPVVLFEPDDLLMIHNSPGSRRLYLDKILLKIDTQYRQILSKYERTLLQRNNLLKKGLDLSVLRDAVFVWDISLSEYGAEIIRRRQALVERINRDLADFYTNISGKKSSLKAIYLPKVVGETQQISKRLFETLELDQARGFTSVGPHRDDLEFELNGQDAKTTASRGEIRTILLALKQIELKLLLEATGEEPIFLLDDVFSELDEERQKIFLSDEFKNQMIITTTDFKSKKWLVKKIEI